MPDIAKFGIPGAMIKIRLVGMRCIEFDSAGSNAMHAASPSLQSNWTRIEWSSKDVSTITFEVLFGELRDALDPGSN